VPRRLVPPIRLTLPPLRFWPRAAALVAVFTGALALALPVASGRTQAPGPRHSAALSAFAAARAGRVPRWAPETLVDVERTLQKALLEWSRQQSRFTLLRDFGPAADALWRAEQAARDASRLAGERYAEARLWADEAIAEVRALHLHGDALSAATALPRSERAHLLRARLLLAEAEAWQREGEPIAAADQAERSQAELVRALGPSLEAAERFTAAEQVRRWRRWVEQTRTWSRSTGRPAILVFKEKNLLTLMRNGVPVRSYPADIGQNALDVKRRVGDKATPEGHYRVVDRKDRGQSRFHRALLLDYPNQEDRRRLAAALRTGDLPRGTRLGGLIEIHGEGGRGRNWTDGCVALSNADMDDLFTRIPLGTRVTIVGGDGRNGTFSDLLARIEGEQKGR